METKRERLLTFKYARNDKTIERADRLCKLLDQNNINYTCYDKSDPYHSCFFRVRRGKNKWFDIIKLINSVKAAKYTYETIDFKVISGVICEVV